ncbi:tRNA pseudouridine(55) synthase TruB [Mycoplasma seminis]|uniref:tRNA pseudouridine synthase B n=1 Tax=Mycoplasma seminis TaxID=512749 RepID=A0ABY9HAS1_9MOLU|nr:tRNA pseudouridine(55) synthase TruB [Mycoplasma seminis]WLP85423.1 tRNA pseudouridine(55) synthase TruB [Mycoplasma seminis]
MFYKFNKPSGVFANKTVRSLQKELNASKIGHTGILDPLAEGLMLVATDFETKMLQYIDDKNKTYIAKALFGKSSDTYDIDGEIITHNEEKITLEELNDAIAYMKTTTSQIPPIFSAKKINGKKAYDYARNNEEVTLREQKIKIFKYDLLEFNYEKQVATLEIMVSEGTYIRSILVDTAAYVNKHCLMSYLKRTQVGNIALDNLPVGKYEAVSIESLINFEIVNLDEFSYKYLKNGNEFKLHKPDGYYLINNPKINLICAIGEVKNNVFHPKKVALERIEKWNN